MKDNLKETFLAGNFSEANAIRIDDSESFFLNMKQLLIRKYIEKDVQKENQRLVTNILEYIDSLFGNKQIFSFLRELVQEGDELSEKTWELIKQALTRYFEDEKYQELSNTIKEEIELGKNYLLAKRQFGAGLVATHGQAELILNHESPLVRAITIKYLARQQKTHTQTLEFLFKVSSSTDDAVSSTATNLLVKMYRPDNEEEFRRFLKDSKKVQNFLNDVHEATKKDFIEGSKKLSDPSYVIECICKQLRITEEEVIQKVNDLKTSLGYVKDDYVIPLLLAQELNVEVGDPDKYLYVQLGVAIQSPHSTFYINIYPLTTIDKVIMKETFCFQGFYEHTAANNGIVVELLSLDAIDETSRSKYPVHKSDNEEFQFNEIVGLTKIIEPYFGEPIVVDRGKNRKYIPYLLMERFDYDTRRLGHEIKFEYVSLACLQGNPELKSVNFSERRVLEIMDWEALASCPKLRSIHIEETIITDEPLVINIPSQLALPHLEEMTISGTWMEEIDLNFLQNSQNLKSLEIENQNLFREKHNFKKITLPELKHLKQLAQMRLSCKRLYTSAFARCQSLKLLDLHVEDTINLSPIQTCNNLEKLTLKINGSIDLSGLHGIANLKELTLRSMTLEWEIVIPFLPALQELEIRGDLVKSINLSEFVDHCPRLSRFDIRANEKCFPDLSVLQGHFQLNRLTLNNEAQDVKYWKHERTRDFNESEISIYNRKHTINQLIHDPNWWEEKGSFTLVKTSLSDPRIDIRYVAARVIETIPNWWEHENLSELLLKRVVGELSIGHSVNLLGMIPNWWENQQIYQAVLSRLKDAEYNPYYISVDLVISIPDWEDRDEIISIVAERFSEFKLQDRLRILNALEGSSSWWKKPNIIRFIVELESATGPIVTLKATITKEFEKKSKWIKEKTINELIPEISFLPNFIHCKDCILLFPSRESDVPVIRFYKYGITLHELQTKEIIQEYSWGDNWSVQETRVKSKDNEPEFHMRYYSEKPLFQFRYSDYIIDTNDWKEVYQKIHRLISGDRDFELISSIDEVNLPFRDIVIKLADKFELLDIDPVEKAVLRESGCINFVDWDKRYELDESIMSIEVKNRHVTKIAWKNRPLPPTISKLTALTDLFISGEKVKQLPREIGNLPKLRNFLLKDSLVKHLPKEIGNLTNLESLHIYSSSNTTLPKSIKRLENLREMMLSGSTLTQLPNEIGNLISLEILVINETRISSLPLSIGNLKRLKGLHLSNNALTRFPESIGNLSHLEILDACSNMLKTLPKTLGKLKRLREISFWENNIHKLPKSIGKLENLVKADLWRNSLKRLPDSIGKLHKLEHLDLHENNLERLPDSIGELENLRWLNISKNRLEYLPANISQLSNLQHLEVNDNMLIALPRTMGNLLKLKSVYVYRNALKDIPIEITNLDLNSLIIDDGVILYSDGSDGDYDSYVIRR